MYVYTFPLWHPTHPLWVHSISSHTWRLSYCWFADYWSELKNTICFRFFIAIPDLPISKTSSKLKFSDTKLWIELYCCLWPIASIPGFTCMARLPLHTCYRVLCMIHPGGQIPQSGPSSLFFLVIVHMSSLYMLQNQTENIYTTLYIFEKMTL